MPASPDVLGKTEFWGLIQLFTPQRGEDWMACHGWKMAPAGLSDWGRWSPPRRALQRFLLRIKQMAMLHRKVVLWQGVRVCVWRPVCLQHLLRGFCVRRRVLRRKEGTCEFVPKLMTQRSWLAPISGSFEGCQWLWPVPEALQSWSEWSWRPRLLPHGAAQAALRQFCPSKQKCPLI